MRRALRRSGAVETDSTVEAALARTLERMERGGRDGAQSLVAAQEPEHAFELRPLVQVALELRTAFAVEGPSPAARAEFMALVRRTSQRGRAPGARSAAEALQRGWSVIRGNGVAQRGAASAAMALGIALFAVLGGFDSDPSAAAATLTVVSGEVERVGSDAVRTAQGGDAVFEGDTLRVGPAGIAILTFIDGSTVQISAGAVVRLSRARFESAPAIRVEQRAGQLIADLAQDGAAATSMLVDAPGAVIHARSGGFAAEVSAEGTRVQAFEFNVAVTSEMGAQVLEPRSSRLIESGSSGWGSPPLPGRSGVPSDRGPDSPPADDVRTDAQSPAGSESLIRSTEITERPPRASP